MPKTNRSPTLENRSKRATILQGKRAAVAVGERLALLYRRGVDGVGYWQARCWTGAGASGYVFASLGEADDLRLADGVSVLDYWQAFERARAWGKDAANRAREATPIPAGRATVSDALDAYFADYVRRGGKGEEYMRHAINRVIRPDLGSIRLDALTTPKLRQWLQSLAERGRAIRSKRGVVVRREDAPTDPDDIRARQATANRLYSVLRAALNYAFRELECVVSDSAWRRVRPFRNVDKPRIRFLTTTEATALIAACPPDLQSLVRAALLTGARFGELSALRISAFNPDTHQLYIAPGKSGRSRYVPLSEEGVQVFAELCDEREKDQAILVRASGAAWGTQHYVRGLRDACVAAGIDPPCSFHELRHTYASLLAQAGADLLTISKLLGHADTRVTSRHYAHLCDRTLAKAVETHLPRFVAKVGNVVYIDPRASASNQSEVA